MDFNSTVDLIIRDLDEARSIIDDFRNYPDVPLIQVELAKSKCKSAAEVISLLKTSYPTEIRQEKKVKPAEVHETIQPEPDKSGIPENILSESPIIADTFSNLPGSLNEQLGALREDENKSGIMKGKQVTNLADAIGVNDRFLFIREIFGGSSEKYTEAIERLNNTSDVSDARAIIMSYSEKHDESDASKQLLDLFKRKLPSNE